MNIFSLIICNIFCCKEININNEKIFFKLVKIVLFLFYYLE